MLAVNVTLCPYTDELGTPVTVIVPGPACDALVESVSVGAAR
jgi:hypothetical protein